MSSELRHRNTKKDKEEEITQEEEEKEVEEEDKEEEKEDKPIVKTRSRKKKEERDPDEPVFASKKIEYSVAIIRAILILVVFTVLHGWVTKYVLDPMTGRDQEQFHFTCPEGMDCAKFREHLEKVHIKE